jgi:hypothetical protein
MTNPASKKLLIEKFEKSAEILAESLLELIKHSQDNQFKCHMISKLKCTDMDSVQERLAHLIGKLKLVEESSEDEGDSTDDDFDTLDETDAVTAEDIDDENEGEVEDNEDFFHDLANTEHALLTGEVENHDDFDFDADNVEAWGSKTTMTMINDDDFEFLASTAEGQECTNDKVHDFEFLSNLNDKI